MGFASGTACSGPSILLVLSQGKTTQLYVVRKSPGGNSTESISKSTSDAQIKQFFLPAQELLHFIVPWFALAPLCTRSRM